MALIERGKVQDGSLVLSKPLSLPEGTEVVVYVEPIGTGNQDTKPNASEDFATLPFFGMWAGREDMSDSVAWVRREREKWHQRAARQG